MKIRENNKSGVALVIVLGLVAVLLIMCVSFSINMRVERAGAANLRHSAMARQLTKGALASAMGEIDADVGGKVSPEWYDKSGPTNPIYSAKGNKYWSDTFASTGIEHLEADFFTPEVESYFPSGLAFKGYSTKYKKPGSQTGGEAIRRPEWVPVYNGAGTNATRNLIGRYAYFVMNTTDLLDISCVNRTNRWMGYSPREITLSDKILDKELKMPSNGDLDLSADGAYESFAELQALREYNSDPSKNVFEKLRSFSTFSYEPPVDPASDDRIVIGKIKDDNGKYESDDDYVDRLRDMKVDIIRAFENCGLDAGEEVKVGGKTFHEQAAWAYLGLIDYVDSDDEMEIDDDITYDGQPIQPWERPATENMPLMSGFMANVKIERCEHAEYDDDEEEWSIDHNKTDFRISAEFKVPFVYPFLESDPAKFKLTGQGRLSESFGKKSPFYGKDENGNLLIDNTKFDVRTLATSGGDPDEDFVVQRIFVGEFECDPEDEDGWWVAKNKNGKPLSIEGLQFFIQASGMTKIDKGGKVLRRFPLDEDWFDDPEEEPDSWMTVPIEVGPDHLDISFDDDDPTDEIPVEKGSKLKKKYWCANVVVWAEFLDPRFACQYMAAGYKNGNFASDFENMFMFYKPSHSFDDYIDVTRHYTIPATELAQWGDDEGNEFDGFDAADDVTEDDFYKKRGAGKDPYGDYFSGRAGRNGGKASLEGAGPVTTYVLTHPSLASDVYCLNMDGIRVDNGEKESTTDNALRKWRAYVKNAPLESVGELGYIPVGIWQTIRLYDYNNKKKVNFGGNKEKELTKFNHIPSDDDSNEAPFHRVLDKFAVREGPVSGRISLGTHNEKILASAFYDLPFGTESGSHLNPNNRRVPEGNDNPKSGAKALAHAFLLGRDKEGSGDLSDIGYLFSYGAGDSRQNSSGKYYALNGNNLGYAASVVSSVTGGSNSFGEFEREALITETCGLLNKRGQTFIIAARGESYSPIFGKTTVEGGTVNAARTGIAQIWRDTVKNSEGKYPIVIQFFKIIDD